MAAAKATHYDTPANREAVEAFKAAFSSASDPLKREAMASTGDPRGLTAEGVNVAKLNRSLDISSGGWRRCKTRIQRGVFGIW